MTLMKNNRWPHQSTQMAQPEGLRLECASTHTIPHFGCVLASVLSKRDNILLSHRQAALDFRERTSKRSPFDIFLRPEPGTLVIHVDLASNNRVRRKNWFHRDGVAPSLDGSQSLQLDTARHISGCCFFSLP